MEDVGEPRFDLHPGKPAPHLIGAAVRRIGDRAIHIVDFGWCPGYVDTIREFSKVRFTQVDRPEFVRYKNPSSHPRLVDAEEIPDDFDIFNATSTLSFIENAAEVLAIAFDRARFSVVLSSHFFCGEEIVEIQKYTRFTWDGKAPYVVPPGFSNMPLPVGFVPIQKLEILEMAARKGFRLIADIDDAGGTWSNGKQTVVPVDLVFERIHKMPTEAR